MIFPLCSIVSYRMSLPLIINISVDHFANNFLTGETRKSKYICGTCKEIQDQSMGTFLESTKQRRQICCESGTIFLPSCHCLLNIYFFSLWDQMPNGSACDAGSGCGCKTFLSCCGVLVSRTLHKILSYSMTVCVFHLELFTYSSPHGTVASRKYHLTKSIHLQLVMVTRKLSGMTRILRFL